MMNMQNLGSKESLWLKFKDAICAQWFLNLRFESNWYFCNITESTWFWKSNLEFFWDCNFFNLYNLKCKALVFFYLNSVSSYSSNMGFFHYKMSCKSVYALYSHVKLKLKVWNANRVTMNSWSWVYQLNSLTQLHPASLKQDFIALWPSSWSSGIPIQG